MTTPIDRISLIIVTWNDDKLLKDCLDSIVRIYQRLPETIIVDNANLASTATLVSNYTNARYVALPENKGFAGGNNAALPYCSKEYLVLLNNDTKFQSDSFSPLIQFLDEHPDAAATQGKIVLANGKTLDGCGGFLSPLGILAFRGAFIPDAPEFDHPKQVFAISGAFFALRRNILGHCGRLFYDHFKSYYEEIDLCHRLHLAGFECWYVPTPPILHHHSVTANKFKRSDILHQYYRNIWFSFLTCFAPAARLRFCALLFMLSIGQSLAALVRGSTAPIKAHLGVWRQVFGPDRTTIRRARDEIASIRKRTDREILAFAVRSQPWSYYRSLLKK